MVRGQSCLLENYHADGDLMGQKNAIKAGSKVRYSLHFRPKISKKSAPS